VGYPNHGINIGEIEFQECVALLLGRRKKFVQGYADPGSSERKEVDEIVSCWPFLVIFLSLVPEEGFDILYLDGVLVI
jgi:hypothetical protein